MTTTYQVNSVTPQPVKLQTMREFIETTMGFGEPIKNPTLVALFDVGTKALHYGSRNGSSYASIDSVSPVRWDAMHFAKDEITYMDVLDHPLKHLHAFLSKEMAKRGLALDDDINIGQGQKLQEVLSKARDFHYQYVQHTAGSARLRTSITLRQHSDTINWDVLLRVAFFGVDESFYFEFTFSQFIRNFAVLITDNQVKEAAYAIRTFCSNFDEHSKVFTEIRGLELSVSTAHLVVLNRGITAEEAWGTYRKLITQNKSLLRTTSDSQTASRVLAWEQLTLIERGIFSQALDVARLNVGAFVSFNMAVAQL